MKESGSFCVQDCKHRACDVMGDNMRNDDILPKLAE